MAFSPELQQGCGLLQCESLSKQHWTLGSSVGAFICICTRNDLCLCIPCVRAPIAETGSARHRQIDAALVRLGKQLRSLSGVALKVVLVQPLSPLARHTSAFVPLPHPFAGGPGARGVKVARCIDPLEVLVQLEGSGESQLFTPRPSLMELPNACKLTTSGGQAVESDGIDACKFTIVRGSG